jgi:general secretion pathway protein J
MRCRRPFRRPAGFTLIELLIAITILALVAVLGWRGLDGIIRARASLTADMEQFRGLQLTFAQLQSDCAQVVSAADFPAHPPLLVTDQGLWLLRSVIEDGQPERYEVVAYRIDKGSLTRTESAASRDLAVIERAWTAAQAGPAPGQGVTLHTGAQAIQLRMLQDPPLGLEIEVLLPGRKAPVSKVILVGPV